jgi:hypothetical protein
VRYSSRALETLKLEEFQGLYTNDIKALKAVPGWKRSLAYFSPFSVVHDLLGARW